MSNKKIAKSFRLNQATVGLLAAYSVENNISQTEVIELAIKRLCRESAAPATQADIHALAQVISAQRTEIMEAIKKQPLLTENKRRKFPFWKK